MCAYTHTSLVLYCIVLCCIVLYCVVFYVTDGVGDVFNVFSKVRKTICVYAELFSGITIIEKPIEGSHGSEVRHPHTTTSNASTNIHNSLRSSYRQFTHSDRSKGGGSGSGSGSSGSGTTSMVGIEIAQEVHEDDEDEGALGMTDVTSQGERKAKSDRELWCDDDNDILCEWLMPAESLMAGPADVSRVVSLNPVELIRLDPSRSSSSNSSSSSCCCYY